MRFFNVKMLQAVLCVLLEFCQDHVKSLLGRLRTRSMAGRWYCIVLLLTYLSISIADEEVFNFDKWLENIVMGSVS